MFCNKNLYLKKDKSDGNRDRLNGEETHSLIRHEHLLCAKQLSKCWTHRSE